MSDYMNDPMVLRQILMDHYEYPRNHKLSNDPAYMKRHMASDSCIDDIPPQAGKIFDNVSTERYNKIYGNPRRWI